MPPVEPFDGSELLELGCLIPVNIEAVAPKVWPRVVVPLGLLKNSGHPHVPPKSLKFRIMARREF